MNLFEMQMKLDDIRSDLGGLQCVRHLLDITANSEDTLSYRQLAGLIGTFIASLDLHVEEIQTLVNNGR
ncbi:hypothetical protein [Haemophilus aegyptius]|uniref:hypothetical protein n=1 Tax=Haemophilus aegyptius TaxID=197575 RepID=UPI000803B14A|nr:hypothetical protein [Haemophilus aegyptius]OBX81105.1 hypothetical protein A9506_08665 [Haemophilus aegyptius]STO62563.1 Uncharacterised protein [Haemophilus aegyptius]